MIKMAHLGIKSKTLDDEIEFFWIISFMWFDLN